MMQDKTGSAISTGFRTLKSVIRRPEALVCLPAATLLSFWAGGERGLIGLALGLPLLCLLAGAFRSSDSGRAWPNGMSGLALRPQIIAAIDTVLSNAPDSGQTTGCLVVLFDDPDVVVDRHGRAAQAEVLARSVDRICGALRAGDTVAQLEGGGLAIVLAPVRRLDLETMVQLSARLQQAVAPPVSLGAARLYVTCSVGFCLGDRAPEANGKALLDAAQIAADEARRHGPGAIRAWAPDMARTRADRNAIREGLELALDEAQIRPWFQPQLSTDTGDISGFEALARWHHPDRGILPPADFLTQIEDAGLSERLGEVILFHALSALARWDKAGLRVPTVAVNFSAAELRNPKLADKLKWELDRFNMTPDRLTVEILETVIAKTDNDVIVANIAALAKLGCGIDLDDFGTGHASITTIRRFAVRRLKIDRSFVAAVDSDRDQQSMVSAILSLAERLGLETLAEGVESPAEHTMLAQLGCGHVQGFGIARPMPLDDTPDWITQYRSRRAKPPRIGHKAR